MSDSLLDASAKHTPIVSHLTLKGLALFGRDVYLLEKSWRNMLRQAKKQRAVAILPKSHVLAAIVKQAIRPQRCLLAAPGDPLC